MDNEETVLEPQVETEPVTETTEVDTSDILAQLEKEKEARRQLTARATKAEAEKRALEARLGEKTGTGLGVNDYIDISTALDGLDQREKAYLAEQHRLSGKPLKDIRSDEDFQLWQGAYRATQQKDSALAPNSTQASEDAPLSFAEMLKRASPAEKEQLLRDKGLYRESRPKTDRVGIGIKRG